MTKISIPTYDALMNPLVQALKSLGGSATIEELTNKVAEIAGLTDEQLEVLHNAAEGGRTEIEYRLAWSRTWLKRYGLLENSSRGIWSLTPKGSQIEKVDEREVVRTVREQIKKAHENKSSVEIEDDNEALPETNWRDELWETIIKISPAAFERLTQRMLRESGFIQVEVTGRSGDGGIDGKGIMRLGGLLGFHVIFQCKKWQGSVSAGEIRDFRGAMVGRADKGLFITTGTFTKDAVREATRDGAPPIDLIDGEQFLDKLKELSLGVDVKKVEVEEITINKDWFTSL
jgi:restriction system protein